MPEGLRFFPQYLQAADYQTAFIGKWHMGNQDDEPQPGFDRWVSFKGQGQYYNPTLNVDGEEVEYSDSTYMTDLLTRRSEEHTSELQSLMRISYAVFCLKKKKIKQHKQTYDNQTK